jgi:surface protein
MAGQLTIMSDSVLELVNAVDEPYAVLSGNNTVLTFYYDKKKEERSGMGVGPFSHYSQRPWQTSADAITTIVIDNSFAQCDTLTNIAWWFYELKNLTQINGMANLKTDHVTDMSHLFAVSWSLPSVDVSHFNTSNVTNMEGMFTSCWALTNLDVSNFNTEKVTNMAGMFNSLSGITTLDISNFNTASVTNMQGIFGSNQSLTTIFVGNGWSTA